MLTTWDTTELYTPYALGKIQDEFIFLNLHISTTSPGTVNVFHGTVRNRRLTDTAFVSCLPGAETSLHLSKALLPVFGPSQDIEFGSLLFLGVRSFLSFPLTDTYQI